MISGFVSIIQTGTQAVLLLGLPQGLHHTAGATEKHLSAVPDTFPSLSEGVVPLYCCYGLQKRMGKGSGSPWLETDSKLRQMDTPRGVYGAAVQLRAGILGLLGLGQNTIHC